MKEGSIFLLLTGSLLLTSCAFRHTARGVSYPNQVKYPRVAWNGDFAITGSPDFRNVGDGEKEAVQWVADFSSRSFWKDSWLSPEIRSVEMVLKIKVNGSAHEDALHFGDVLIRHGFPELKITNGRSTQVFEGIRVTVTDPEMLAAVIEEVRKGEGRLPIMWLDDATIIEAKLTFRSYR